MVFPSGVMVVSWLRNSSWGGNGSFFGTSSFSAARARPDDTSGGRSDPPTTVPDVRRKCLRDSVFMMFPLACLLYTQRIGSRLADDDGLRQLLEVGVRSHELRAVAS